MKNVIIIISALMFISCSNKKNQNIYLKKEQEQSNKDVAILADTIKKDTVYYYWQPDYAFYEFDTVINEISYYMKTYCLNDSAVLNETWSDSRSQNPQLIEYQAAHNYVTDFKINSSISHYEIKLLKENFRDSLPTEFFQICHMWKNEFENIENEQPVFRATFAQPDTDWQYAIMYTITAEGKLIIIRVEDESFYD
jgi:hypothetical protein